MKVTMKGFKAVDRTVDLSARTLVVAPNGSGKSAIVDAIRFAALGYVPHLGKTADATALLMAGNELFVQVQLEDGRSFNRVLRRVGDRLESFVGASWVASRTRAEHEAAIQALFGETEEDVAEAMDVRELLSLSPAKRAARFEKIVGSGATESLPVRVARATIARLLGLEPAQLPADIEPALEQLPEGRAVVLAEIGEVLTASLRDDGLAPVIAHVSKAKTEVEADARRRTAARAELLSRIQSLGEVALAIEDLEAERDRLQRTVGASTQWQRAEAGRLDRLDKANAELAAKREALDAALVQMERIRKNAIGMIEALEAKPQEYDEQIGALQAMVFSMSVENERLKYIEQIIPTIVDEPVEDLSRYEKAVQQLATEYAGASTSPWAEVREIGKRLDENYHTNDGARLIALADENGGNLVSLESQLQTARDALQLAGERAAAAATVNLKNAERRQELETEAAVLRTQKSEASAHVKRREKERDAEVEALREKKVAAVNAIAQQRENIKAQETHVDGLRTAVKELQATVNALSSATPAPAESATAEELERVIAQISTATAQASLNSELAKITKELDRKDAEVDVYRALEWALKRIREEDLAGRGVPVVDAIASFLRAAGRSEVPYFESGREVCDVGWIREDGKRVSIRTLSGGEYALFCSALSCALSTCRGGELRILLAEAAEADDQVLVEIMNGAEPAALTNALVCTAHPIAGDGENVVPRWGEIWQVINIGRKAVA